MDTVPEDPILLYPVDIVNIIRKTYNLDKPGDMNAAIDILETWMKKQEHFIFKDFSREYLERCIVRCKGSIERAKERLDGMCTARTFLTNIYTDCNIKDSELDFIHHALLPKMTNDFYRVCLLRDDGQKITSDLLVKKYIRMVHFAEYISAHDYCNGFIGVLDYRTTNLTELLKNADVSLAEQVLNLILKSYGMRVKAIHLISSSSLANVVLGIFKRVVSNKVSNRIFLHKDLETLHENIEKDILPEEYGGNEKPLKELHGKWMEILSSEHFMEYMKKMNAAKTDESLRKSEALNNQYLGIPGTFRSLNVD